MSVDRSTAHRDRTWMNPERLRLKGAVFPATRGTERLTPPGSSVEFLHCFADRLRHPDEHRESDQHRFIVVASSWRYCLPVTFVVADDAGDLPCAIDDASGREHRRVGWVCDWPVLVSHKLMLVLGRRVTRTSAEPASYRLNQRGRAFTRPRCDRIRLTA